jgi:hypothetical protein
MSEIKYERGGKIFNINIQPPPAKFGSRQDSDFDFTCVVTDGQDQQIFLSRISESLTPYFERSYKQTIPAFLEHSAKMFVDFYLQKLALLGKSNA